MDIQAWMKEKTALVERTLGALLPAGDSRPEVLHKAMRYSLFAGGKRVRPLLALAAARAAGGKEEVTLRPACALEMIHTYSLIHDDLPALDNDELRRGKPTCHKAFGEANAILAGSGLLTLALEVLATWPEGDAHAPARCHATRSVCRAIGLDGMIGGQVADLEAENRAVGEEDMLYIHSRKTGALIGVSLRMGGIYAGAGAEALDALEAVGRKMGLCFQIVDDVLNVEGDPVSLGKAAGSDSARKKATYPKLFGLEESKRRAQALTDEIVATLGAWGEEAETLRQMALFLLHRKA
jgi:geranylgeranyl diphosphate synthase type II